MRSTDRRQMCHQSDRCMNLEIPVFSYRKKLLKSLSHASNTLLPLHCPKVFHVIALLAQLTLATQHLQSPGFAHIWGGGGGVPNFQWHTFSLAGVE